MSKSDQLTDFNIHAVGFQLGVGALGDVQPHQLELCDHLVLCHGSAPAQALDIVSDVHIGPYLLHLSHPNSSFRYCETYVLSLPGFCDKMFRDKETFMLEGM